MNKKILLTTLIGLSLMISGIFFFAQGATAKGEMCPTLEELDARYLKIDLSNSDSAVFNGDLQVTGDLNALGLASSYQGVETQEFLRLDGKFICLNRAKNGLVVQATPCE